MTLEELQKKINDVKDYFRKCSTNKDCWKNIKIKVISDNFPIEKDINDAKEAFIDLDMENVDGTNMENIFCITI